MTVTFLATVRLDDLSDLPGVATEISDDLTQGGFEVISVVPWARPSLGPQTGITTTVPITTQPIQNQINEQT